MFTMPERQNPLSQVLQGLTEAAGPYIQQRKAQKAQNAIFETLSNIGEDATPIQFTRALYSNPNIRPEDRQAAAKTYLDLQGAQSKKNAGQFNADKLEAQEKRLNRLADLRKEELDLKRIIGEKGFESKENQTAMQERLGRLKNEREIAHLGMTEDLKRIDQDLAKARLAFDEAKFSKNHDLAQQTLETKNSLEDQKSRLNYEIALNNQSLKEQELQDRRQAEAEKIAQKGEQFEKKHGLSVYDREHKQVEEAYKEQAKTKSREAMRGVLQSLPEGASPGEVAAAFYEHRDILPEDRKDAANIIKMMKEAQTNAVRATQPKGGRGTEETGPTKAQKQDILRYNIERDRVGEPPLTEEQENGLLGYLNSPKAQPETKNTPSTIEKASAQSLAEGVMRPLKKGEQAPDYKGIVENREQEAQKAEKAELRLSGKSRGEQFKANRKYNTVQLDEAQKAVEHYNDLDRTIGNLENLNNSGDLPGWFGRAMLDPETGDPGTIAKIFGTSATSQLFSKNLNALISNIRGDVGAVRSNYEINRYMAQFPALLNTEDGRRVILRQMQINNDIKKLDKQSVIDVLSGRSLEEVSPTELLQKSNEKAEAKRKDLMAEMGYLTAHAEEIAQKRMPDRLPDQKQFNDVPENMRFEGSTIHNDKKKFFTYRNGYWEPSLGKKSR